MPLKLIGDTLLRTNASSLMIGATPVSYSIWVRVDSSLGGNDDNPLLGTIPFYAHTSLNFPGFFKAYYFLNDGAANNSGNIQYSSLISNANYHVVLTVASGEQKLYVNGTMVASDSVVGVDGNLGDSNPRPFCVGCTSGVNLTIQEPTVWIGYKLTQADVTSLRNGATPSSISPSNIKWSLTLSGTDGATAVLSDAGLTDQSSSVLDVTSITTSVGGSPAVAPTYQGAPLFYQPPARIGSARVTPTRDGIVLIFEDLNGNTANLSALGTSPQLTTQSLNGGAAFTLTNPVWGLTAPPYLPWVYYPLSGAIGAGDTPTITAASDGWATTTAGTVAAVAEMPVDNTTRATLLPPFDYGRKAMEIGYNVGSAPIYYLTFPIYANLARQIAGWYGAAFTQDRFGYPTSIASGQYILGIVSQSGDDGTASGKGFYNQPNSGTWTLMWDGPGIDPVSGEPVLVLSSEAQTGENISEVSRRIAASGSRQYDNTIQYSVTQDQANSWSPSIYAKARLGGFTNLRIYPPGVAIDGSQVFHPNYLRALANAKCLRFMGTIDPQGPGSGGAITDYSDFTPVENLGYNMVGRSPGAAVASVEPYADSENYFGNTATALITFSAPHGYKDANYCSPAIPGPGGDTFPFPLTNGGGTGYLIPFGGGGYNAQVRVIDATHLAMPLGGVTTPNIKCTLTTTYTRPVSPTAGFWATGIAAYSSFGQVWDQTYPGLPPQEAADLCNAVGADMWYSVSYGMTDACVTSLFTMLGQRIAPGRKFYVEYSNEVWNFGYPGQIYCDAHARVDGLSNRFQWYAKRAAQVHDLAKAALAISGRGGDLVRVFGAQGAWAGGSTQPIVSYAAAQVPPLKIDAIAVAPYFENDPAPGFGNVEYSLSTIYDTLSSDQLVDLGELFIQYGGYYHYISDHYAVLAANYPATDVICYEGGPELGLPASNLTSGSPAWVIREHIWARHPRMRWIMLHFLQILQDNGCTLFNDFMVSSADEFKRGYNWHAYYTWSMEPGLGDGTDGLYDNRLNFGNYDQLVSVVGGAINEWNSLVPSGIPSSFAKPINNISTTVALAYTAGSGSLAVTSTAGITLSDGEWIRVGTSRNGIPLSILRGIAVSGNVLTIAGGADGSTDVDLLVGDVAELRVTAGAFSDIHSAIVELQETSASSVSPAFTGEPTAPTAPLGTDTDQLATCAFVVNNVSSIISALDTLTLNAVNSQGSMNIGASWPGGADAYSGLWIGQSAPDSTNYSLLATDGADGLSPGVPVTYFNAPTSSGLMFFRQDNVDVFRIAGGRAVFADSRSIAGDPSASLSIVATADNRRPLSVMAHGGAQSADLQQWQDFSGAVLASVSPAGIITAATPTTADNSTKVATTAFVKAQNYTTSVFGRTGAIVAATNDYSVGQVTGAAPLASPTFTGTPAAPTPATADSSTAIATTAFVKAQGYATGGDIVSPLVSTPVSITGATGLSSTAFGKMHVCSGTAADYTVTLPSPTGNAGKSIGFRMDPALTRFVTISRNSAENIDGATTRIMWANEAAILLCDGTNWSKVAGKSIPLACKLTVNTGNAPTDGSLVLFNAAPIDNSTRMADTAGHRIFIRRGGYYKVDAQIITQSSTGTSIALWIERNGAGFENPSMQFTSASMGHHSIVQSYNTGDYIIFVCQYGTALAVNTSGPLTYLFAVEIPSW